MHEEWEDWWSGPSGLTAVRQLPSFPHKINTQTHKYAHALSLHSLSAFTPSSLLHCFHFPTASVCFVTTSTFLQQCLWLWEVQLPQG